MVDDGAKECEAASYAGDAEDNVCRGTKHPGILDKIAENAQKRKEVTQDVEGFIVHVKKADYAVFRGGWRLAIIVPNVGVEA